MGPFTTREQAIGFWFFMLLALGIARRETRRSLFGILRVAGHWKLLVPFIVFAVYTGFIVYGLYTVHLWTKDLTKDTLLWFLFSGVSLTFSGMDIDSKVSIWQRAFKNQLKIVVLIEYFVNTYTFSIWIELALVPFLAIIAMLDAISESRSEYSDLAKQFKCLQAFVGFAIISSAIQEALSSIDTFRLSDAVRAVALPPFFSILTIPCAFLFFLLAAYDLIFLSLKLGVYKKPAILRYAKMKLFMQIGLQPNIAREAARQYASELRQINSKEDVDRLIARLTMDFAAGKMGLDYKADS